MRRAVTAVVAVWLALCALAGARATAAAPAPASGPTLVVLVPDLRWTDVAAMPTLRGLLARGAVGVVSVRSQAESTRCGDALLEISAMTRVPGGVGSCAVPPTALAALRDRYRHNRYDARVGLLGDLAHGLVAAGDASAAAATAPSAGPEAPDPSAPVVVTVDSGLYAAGADRVAAAGTVDGHLAGTVASAGPAATVVVVGCSDGPAGGPHLHPIVVAGPGWPHRALTSASTGRAPYVQLFDLGPTLLASVGVTDLPSQVAGRPMRASVASVASVASYVDLDRHARRALTVGHPTFTVLCALLLGCLLLLALRRPEAAWVARLLVAAPLATWLVQLLPWWRWPVAAYAVAVAALALVASGAWRAVPAVTAAVLLVDQLAGGRLQRSAPFGDNPLVAGRFHGLGNIAFGVAMGALLLCAARRGWRVAAVLVAVGIVVDGAPMLGADLGGVVTLVVAGGLLVAILAGLRPSPLRVVVAGAIAAVAAAALAALDYARPPDSQTHLGRFVGQVLHGGAWRVVHRKLDAVLASFTNPVVTVTVVACLVAVLVLRRSLDVALLVPLTVLAVVGSAVNDSGVFVAAAVALAVVPALVLGRLRDNPRL